MSAGRLRMGAAKRVSDREDIELVPMNRERTGDYARADLYFVTICSKDSRSKFFAQSSDQAVAQFASRFARGTGTEPRATTSRRALPA
ncbi:MAG: hypothetical protein ACRDFS_06510 [Chloroflexota bacterium]